MLMKKIIHLLHQVSLINKFIYIYILLSSNIIVPFDLKNPNDHDHIC